MSKVAKTGTPKRVYMPSAFDCDEWRDDPKAWLPELEKRGAIYADGTAAFHTADTLARVDVTLDVDCIFHVAPPKETNGFTFLMDGDVADEARSLEMIESHLRGAQYGPESFPLYGELIFWNFHKDKVLLRVLDVTEESFVSPCPLPSAYEREVLTIVIEEASEIQKRATKLLRFGRDEVQPGQSRSNKDRLSDEIGDLMAILTLAEEAELVCSKRAERAAGPKFEKLRKYMQTRPTDEQ